MLSLRPLKGALPLGKGEKFTSQKRVNYALRSAPEKAIRVPSRPVEIKRYTNMYYSLPRARSLWTLR